MKFSSLNRDDKVLLSVILPVYNGEEYLEEAIHSFLKQEMDFEAELIIVDDGSIDETLLIARRIQENYHNVKIIELKSNMGKGEAVGIGYNASLGKYVHILDADDYFLEKDKLQIQVDFMESHPTFCASAHNTLIIEESKESYLMLNLDQEIDFTYESIMKFEFYCHTSSVIVRKIADGLDSNFRKTNSLRGDSAFLYYHAHHFKGGLHYFPMVASAYRIHGKGIWSGLTHDEKHVLHKQLFQDLQTVVITDACAIEHEWLEQKLRDFH
jgi:glycosyltransferase involved in cell wall biosynthesis